MPNGEVPGVMLTFTDQTQELSGMIQDVMGNATADFTIVVFPADNRYWVPQTRRIMSARPGTDGRFTFRNLPPGEYRLTAITDAEPGEWFNPAFLTQLAARRFRFRSAKASARCRIFASPAAGRAGPARPSRHQRSIRRAGQARPLQ